jgi:hypothetical protein
MNTVVISISFALAGANLACMLSKQVSFPVRVFNGIAFGLCLALGITSLIK